VLPKFDDGSELAGAIKSLFSASGMVILEFDGIKKMNRRRLNSLLGGQLY
jgi:hypothetical protein